MGAAGAGRRAGGDPSAAPLSLGTLGAALAAGYDDVLSEGVPAHLAALARRLDGGAGACDRAEPTSGPAAPARSLPRRAVVIASDAAERDRACAVLGRGGLTVIACADAGQALTALLAHGDDVALLLADARTDAGRGELPILHAAATLWPTMHRVVLTGLSGPSRSALPPGTDLLPASWRAPALTALARRAPRPAVA